MFSTRTSFCCLVISLALLVASKCNGEGFDPAPSCARYECPAYTVTHTEKEFEIRVYKEARWVHGPNISSNSYEAAFSKGFKMLSDYYNGQNREGMKINTTSPFLVRVDKSSYEFYFYLPKQNQIFAPRPLTPEINPEMIPIWKHRYVAVRRFDGSINDAAINAQLEALKKSLKSSAFYQRAADQGDVFMVADYNSPSDLKNRVNEVFIWFN